MHLIELARAVQADRERGFRRSWRTGWWAALRHPRTVVADQADEAPAATSRGARRVPRSPGRRAAAATGTAATGSTP